jgi:hypothetical protein
MRRLRKRDANQQYFSTRTSPRISHIFPTPDDRTFSTPVRLEEAKALVRVPHGEVLEEWLAAHCVDFYREAEALLTLVGSRCTEFSCPCMKACPEFECLWADSEGGLHCPKRVSAPEYAELLMTWIEKLLNDEAVFPSSTARDFPKRFREAYVSKIMRRLFRLYAHVYHFHFDVVMDLEAADGVNDTFRRFVLFSREHALLTPKDEQPLADLITYMLNNPGATLSDSTASSLSASGSRSGGVGFGSSGVRGGSLPLRESSGRFLPVHGPSLSQDGTAPERCPRESDDVVIVRNGKVPISPLETGLVQSAAAAAAAARLPELSADTMSWSIDEEDAKRASESLPKRSRDQIGPMGCIVA